MCDISGLGRPVIEIRKKNQKKKQKNKYSNENNILSQTTAITNKKHLEMRRKKIPSKQKQYLERKRNKSLETQSIQK